MQYKKYINQILPIDIVTLGYILVTALYVIFGAPKLQDTATHLCWRLIFTGIIVLMVYLSAHTKNKFLHFLRHFYVLGFLAYFYPETDSLNNLFFYDLDPYVANLEITIFGGHPSVWFSHGFPWKWFNELMNFGYFSYYPLIIGLCITLYIRNKANFMFSMFTICMSFFMYYIIFILFPVAGPQFYLTPPDNQLPPAYLFRSVIKFIQELGERPTAAFPSSHVGITCIVVYLAYKFHPRLLRWYIPAAVLLCLSTVYIKAHYAIDVIAGFLTVPTMYWISSRTYSLIIHGLSEEYKIHTLYEKLVASLNYVCDKRFRSK